MNIYLESELRLVHDQQPRGRTTEVVDMVNS